MFDRANKEVTDVIQHHWDGRAPNFDNEAEHGLRSEEQRQAWLKVLGEIAGPSPVNVLDIGCGTGFLAMRFAELGHRVTGIDFAPQMIEIARAKARAANLDIQFHVQNAMALAEPSATYEVVIARHVIWTMPQPAIAVQEWLRVLRPEGRLALIEGKWADNAALARANASPLRATFAKLIDAGLATLTYARRGRKSSTVYARKYRRIQAQLPFSGGPSAEVLAQFLGEHGLRNIQTQPLMDALLWGEPSKFARYLTVGTRA